MEEMRSSVTNIFTAIGGTSIPSATDEYMTLCVIFDDEQLKAHISHERAMLRIAVAGHVLVTSDLITIY